MNLHKKVSSSIWFAFARPAKRVTQGDLIMFHDSVVAKVLEKNRGELLLEFELSDNDLMELVRKNAYNLMEQKFSWQRIGMLTNDAYNKISYFYKK